MAAFEKPVLNPQFTRKRRVFRGLQGLRRCQFEGLRLQGAPAEPELERKRQGELREARA